MGEFQAIGYVCERCKHKWVPRDQVYKPAVCPKCKSPYWNRERVVRFAGDTKGHENTIPIQRSVKEIAKRTIEENELVFDRLANV